MSHRKGPVLTAALAVAITVVTSTLGATAARAEADTISGRLVTVDEDTLAGGEGASWYGWQIALVDALNTYALISTRADGGAAHLMGYFGSGPLIHASRHNAGGVTRSMALRIGAPFVLGYTHGLEGAASGALLAMAVDALALGWDDPRATSSRGVAPSAGATDEHVFVGVVGRF
jgi:hypothetical protein